MKLADLLKKQVVFAFNCDDFVVYRGVVEAVRETKTPVIIQLSPGELNFWGLKRFVSVARTEDLPLFINFDHSRDLSLVKKIIDLRVDMVHFDGSDLSWQENLDLTKEVVGLAHKKGILVEGEPERENTRPEKVSEFIDKTGVDIVAVFAGNRHGMDPDKPERINFNQLKGLRQAADNKFLALHGGSGVYQTDIDQVIDMGLVDKININSRLRLVFRKKLEEEIKSYTGVKIYHLLEPVMTAIKEEVIRVISFINGKR